MQNVGRELLDQIIDELANAVDGPETQEKVRNFLAVMGRFHKYSWGNQGLIAWQRPNATHVAGFNTWKSMGRFVKKGEKGIAILAPCNYAKDEETEDGTTRRVSGMFFRTVYVFDIEQTEGKPIKDLDLFQTIDGNYDDVERKLMAFAATKGIKVSTVDLGGGTYGVSYGGSIDLKSALESGRKVLVLIHELAHEILHKNENRKGTTKLDRETDAEAVAYVVGMQLGIPCPDSASYLRLYGGTAASIKTRLTTIHTAVNEILGAFETKSVRAAA